MKRVEDFETFCVGGVWFHRDDEGNVKVSIHNEKTWLTPDDWAEVEQKIRTVDVPEPWERVRDALDAVFGIGRTRAYPCSEEQCRRIADALGIKPEGES